MAKSFNSSFNEMFSGVSNKDKNVRDEWISKGSSFINSMNPYSVKMVLPKVFFVMKDPKWQTKEFACGFLENLALTHKNVCVYLPEIVPVVTDCMLDLKQVVKDSATKALIACCQIDNKDIEPFIPHLVKSIGSPQDVPECVHNLSATTFVQSVDAKTLSILTPLLVRGLADRTTPVRRKTCVIIRNMAKLVDDPSDAAKFAYLLVDKVKSAAEGMSNPEARKVAEECLDILSSIDTSFVNTTENTDITSVVKKYTDDYEYVSGIVEHLIDLKEFNVDIWKSAIDVEDFSGLYDTCFEEVKKKNVTNDDDEEVGEDLCDCEFSLAYGGKILLNNTRFNLKRGNRYGLCGPNGAGKSTLMRAIVNGQLEGFPSADVLKTAYVEHDLDGSDSNMAIIDFIANDEQVKENIWSREKIVTTLESVGFDIERQSAPINTLSGGWKMKLALARAMLLNAKLLLLDEPTNHLSVSNVRWLIEYLINLKDVSCVIVSHDSGFLDAVCTSIIHYEPNLKLKKYKGNLSEFVKKRPESASYYALTETKTTWKFPEPGFLEGITSKDRAIMKLRGVGFKYPGTEKLIFDNVNAQVSLNSRIGVVGENGAGKSTLIKVLTGQMEATNGSVWKHPNMRLAYVAQHAFHHIEDHLDMTPNQYIQWRYASGEDKETLDVVSRKNNEEELKKMYDTKVVDGVKKILDKILGRRKLKKSYEYEVQWKNDETTQWISRERLEEYGFGKLLNDIDTKEAVANGMFKPLTAKNVEEHMANVGLDPEFTTHSRIRGLSGGQKLKLVIGAALWQQPHVIVLDEPTNFVDRESLGAMAEALKNFGGGVVIISHSNEFVKNVCIENWTVDGGVVHITGQSAAMLDAIKLELKKETEYTDALGNTIKIKEEKRELSRQEKKKRAKERKMRKARGEEVSDSDDEY
ncbi:elongation factor 3 [Paramecium bursaria Chlorella virus MA1D]|nr:elongation factor 3 [Paramecium bursaria Chlorella virus MA1D]